MAFLVRSRCDVHFNRASLLWAFPNLVADSAPLITGIIGESVTLKSFHTLAGLTNVDNLFRSNEAIDEQIRQVVHGLHKFTRDVFVRADRFWVPFRGTLLEVPDFLKSRQFLLTLFDNFAVRRSHSKPSW